MLCPHCYTQIPSFARRCPNCTTVFTADDFKGYGFFGFLGDLFKFFVFLFVVLALIANLHEIIAFFNSTWAAITASDIYPLVKPVLDTIVGVVKFFVDIIVFIFNEFTS